MSTSVTISNPPGLGYPQVAREFVGAYRTVLSDVQVIPSHQIEHSDLTAVADISIPDFGCLIAAPIVNLIPKTSAGKVTLDVAVDEDIIVGIELSGHLDKRRGQFLIEQTELKIKEVKNRARADFVASTLWAMLGLAEKVLLQIPELELDLSLTLGVELSKLSEMLQRRLLAYRIMVIEQATGHEFELPPFISPDQVKSIALIYHAIALRSFEWPIEFVEYGFPASESVLKRLVELNNLPVIKFGPNSFSETLFGRLISLGEGFVTVKDKVIDDFDRIREELTRDDGHIVRVVIRSLSGHGVYDLPQAPRLPMPPPWDARIRRFVNLEEQLDGRLATRYHDLAAATLEGLSPEEKKEITIRPELDEAAFLTDH